MHNTNVHGFPPNLDPQVFAFLAVLIGSACVGDYTANEQNSFGNWLILVGQFILTTAAQQQLVENIKVVALFMLIIVKVIKPNVLKLTFYLML